MGNVAIDFKNKLLETLNNLPEDKQIEVLDFADFVKAKLESQEVLSDAETMARLKESEEDLKAGRLVEWKKVRQDV